MTFDEILTQVLELRQLSTIRDDHRRWQGHAASAECCHASIEHALHPVQFVTAWRPRA